jgi:prepilin-type N-terminal cleavage/methylation domain-containing protein
LVVHLSNPRRLPSGQTIHSRTPAFFGREGGFTLIEVLVVVAILGLVATIVVMNIAGFSRSGAVNAANTEAHQVQTALIAYMQANNLSTWDGTVGDGSEQELERYLLNAGQLQAKYTVSNGKIADAYAYPDGKWAGCTWDAEEYGWRRSE